jgi:hypothetical protein
MGLGVRQIEPTCRNQVRNTSGQELWIIIIKITDRNTGTGSLVRVVKESVGIVDRNYWGWKRELTF